MWTRLGSTERAIARRCRGLVVSCCNPPHAWVGVHRHDGRDLVRLPLQPAEQFTGLAADDEHLYVATQGRSVARVVALTRATWTVAWDVPLPAADDVHSIAVTVGYLYAVSTGTDSVIRYRLDHCVGDPEVVWSPTGADEAHTISTGSHCGTDRSSSRRSVRVAVIDGPGPVTATSTTGRGVHRSRKGSTTRTRFSPGGRALVV
jgi:hypothetical protein